MKGFLIGIAGMVIISVGAAIILDNLDYSSKARNTTESGSVRLGQ